VTTATPLLAEPRTRSSILEWCRLLGPGHPSRRLIPPDTWRLCAHERRARRQPARERYARRLRPRLAPGVWLRVRHLPTRHLPTRWLSSAGYVTGGYGPAGYTPETGAYPPGAYQPGAYPPGAYPPGSYGPVANQLAEPARPKRGRKALAVFAAALVLVGVGGGAGIAYVTRQNKPLQQDWLPRPPGTH